MTWNPPAASESDIDHYIVHVPIRNISNNVSSAITVLNIRDCHDSDIDILVAAVNHFGCEGMNSSEITPSLFFDNPRTTDDGYTTVTPTEDEPTSIFSK